MTGKQIDAAPAGHDEDDFVSPMLPPKPSRNTSERSMSFSSEAKTPSRKTSLSIPRGGTLSPRGEQLQGGDSPPSRKLGERRRSDELRRKREMGEHVEEEGGEIHGRKTPTIDEEGGAPAGEEASPGGAGEEEKPVASVANEAADTEPTPPETVNGATVVES